MIVTKKMEENCNRSASFLGLLVVLCMHCRRVVRTEGGVPSKYTQGLSKGGLCNPMCKESEGFYAKIAARRKELGK